MSKRLIAFISIVSFCVIAIFYDGGVAAEKPATPAIDGEMTFGDKIVVVFVARSAALETRNDSIAMKNAKVAIMGNRYFIRGTAVMKKEEKQYERFKWYDGIDTAVDWSTVYQIYVLTNEQYDGYIKYVEEDEE